MPHVLLLALLGAAPSVTGDEPPTSPPPTSAARASDAPPVTGDEPSTSPPSPPGARASSGEAPTLEQVLLALAEEERRKEANSDCTFRERNRTEELAEDGSVKGVMTRAWAMTRRNGETTRKLLSSKRRGEVNAVLTKEPKEPDAKERKAQRSPFHPEVQSEYRFRLISSNPKELQVGFEPLERSDKRLVGTATIDAAKRVLTALSGSPSKPPPMVERLELDLRYAPTPCGVQPVHIRVKGTGGFLFFKTRFRSETWHESHASPGR